MFGEDYISQYVLSQYKAISEQKTLRIYITEALRIIGENTAKAVGGRSLTKSYIDIIEPKKEEKPKETAVQAKKRLLDKFKHDFEGKEE